jgi:hypothetical protein
MEPATNREGGRLTRAADPGGATWFVPQIARVIWFENQAHFAGVKHPGNGASQDSRSLLCFQGKVDLRGLPFFDFHFLRGRARLAMRCFDRVFPGRYVGNFERAVLR